MKSALTSILNAQHAWAKNLVKIHRGCTLTLDANLFHHLHDETLKEFRAGAGNETGQAAPGKKRAKMLSLRSSSVLVANVFDYWRGRDLTGLAWALDAKGNYSGLKFERPFDHGLSTGKPHLDVVLYPKGARQPFAIESKFTEPYSVKHDAKTAPIAAKYFPKSWKRWEKLGLPRCQELAETLGHTKFYHSLDAVQLLKHILGLANDPKGHVGPERRVTLHYLWFDTGCTEAQKHRDEIVDFKGLLDVQIDFRSMTHQKLFERLALVGEPDYVEYLRMRYFPGVIQAPAPPLTV